MSKPHKLAPTKNISKLYKIYNILIQRLPHTFPRAALVVHTNLEELQKYYTDTEGVEENEDDLPIAFCDSETYTVHLDLTVNKEPPEEIASLLLHELGHLYAAYRYGRKSNRWLSERNANRFASRWLRKIKKEGLLDL